MDAFKYRSGGSFSWFSGDYSLPLTTYPIEPGGGGKGNGELQTIRDIAFRISLIAGGSD